MGERARANAIPPDADNDGETAMQPDDTEHTIAVNEAGLEKLLEADAALAESGAASSESIATENLLDNEEDDGLMSIGNVRFEGHLTLVEQRTGIPIEVDGDSLDRATIGRLNRRTAHRPHIDLTDFIKPRDGVSRLHASISQRGDLLFITDHKSLNGTFLNGHRLIPEQSRILRDSDILRVGRIVLTVSFADLTPPTIPE